MLTKPNASLLRSPQSSTFLDSGLGWDQHDSHAASEGSEDSGIESNVRDEAAWRKRVQRAHGTYKSY